MEHLKPDEISPAYRSAAVDPVAIKTLADAERAHITATLRETRWVIGGPRGAAAKLGLPRTTLMARMQRLGISSDSSRSRSGRLVPMMGAGPFLAFER